MANHLPPKGMPPEGMLLGRQVAGSDHYAPELLCPIPRRLAREQLGLTEQMLPFDGVDLWHAYELSWLDGAGRPQAFVGRFSIPASTPNLIESKSFKLYLNSLNNERYASAEAAVQVICRDLSEAAGGPVTLELFSIDAQALAGRPLPGECLDHLPVSWSAQEPDVSQLQLSEDSTAGTIPAGTMEVFTHLLRSLCPVTGQPDWASVWIKLEGRQLINQASLLDYLLSYRNHQEFHEQCVERIFRDLMTVSEPRALQVQAFYTRRGGLDITPYRSNGAVTSLPRMIRQ